MKQKSGFQYGFHVTYQRYSALSDKVADEVFMQSISILTLKQDASNSSWVLAIA